MGLKLGLWLRLRLGCRGTSKSRKGLKGTVGERSGIGVELEV